MRIWRLKKVRKWTPWWWSRSPSWVCCSLGSQFSGDSYPSSSIGAWPTSIGWRRPTAIAGGQWARSWCPWRSHRWYIYTRKYSDISQRTEANITIDFSLKAGHSGEKRILERGVYSNIVISYLFRDVYALNYALKYTEAKRREDQQEEIRWVSRSRRPFYSI